MYIWVYGRVAKQEENISKPNKSYNNLRNNQEQTRKSQENAVTELNPRVY